MKRCALVFVVVLLATSAFAQEKGNTAFSVMATNLSVVSSDVSGTIVTGGVAFGLNYWMAPRWSAELSASIERTSTPDLPENPDPAALYVVRRIRSTTFPVDALAQFHIPTGDTRWKPYVGAGAHYNEVPSRIESKFTGNVWPQVNVGTYVMLRPRLALRFDGKFLVRSESAPWDSNVRGSAGLSWRF